MCAVFGALLVDINTPERMVAVNSILEGIYRASHERGRDGRGYMGVFDTGKICVYPSYKDTSRIEHGKDAVLMPAVTTRTKRGVLVGNLRAEPTTEYVKNKRHEDQQPYKVKDWVVVHNGTIANDKTLRTLDYPSKIDSAAIPEALNLWASDTSKVNKTRGTFYRFQDTVRKFKGSYAILAYHESEPDQILIAVNYRPVWYVHTEYGLFFASTREYLPFGYSPAMCDPYTVTSFVYNEEGRLIRTSVPLWEPAEPRRALVVCSGGLDSIVAATVAVRRLSYEVELLHFRYGSRAQRPEERAVSDCAAALGVNVRYMDLPIYNPKDSPLLRENSEIAGGEEGAEFAHEWVPARNLLLLSVATAYAEANGFDTLILGNNLEEAGAYPDNEPEFISRFNDLLDFAVADGKRIRVEMPVGNMMKHEIVKLGLEIGAPLEKTWSCYRAGSKHCGTCGPCFMRRTAFKINDTPEVIEYVSLY